MFAVVPIRILLSFLNLRDYFWGTYPFKVISFAEGNCSRMEPIPVL